MSRWEINFHASKRPKTPGRDLAWRGQSKRGEGNEKSMADILQTKDTSVALFWPQNKKSQKGCVGLPYYGDMVWAGGRTVPNKQRWAASFLSLFLWESYRLCGSRNPPYHGLHFV